MCYPDFNISSLCISQAAFTSEKLHWSTISWLLLHVNSLVLLQNNLLNQMCQWLTRGRSRMNTWMGRTDLNGHCWIMQFSLLQLKAKSLRNHELLLKTNEAIHFYIILLALSRSYIVLRAWDKARSAGVNTWERHSSMRTRLASILLIMWKF